MNLTVLNKAYDSPAVCEKEILRYAGCKSVDRETQKLLNLCLNEVLGKLTYKVCYCELPITVNEDVCDFDVFKVSSQKLAANLKDCKRVILLAATVGIEIDRLITKYGYISPAKALMFQAIGAERIEALCDNFCADIENSLKISLKPRFSPGYGDLPLETQKQIFAVLDCPKRIGLTLNESLLMSPSKSVTAFAGISDKTTEKPIITNKCALCDKKDCAFRGAL
ncbi:MAG: vitamin B12 dependent-methionine synthase activation domain-containing protein [Acutalibacteraceae bacterium]|nr:vitamin B12 dependent-methionine synthase activation domain-containing protein [Acutalibacteraceae bacterium]